MLALRPTCEHCEKELNANSTDAMICSYECTFCVACVENILNNVCPNCGGGFSPRPIRPQSSWRAGTGLDNHPASNNKVTKPVDIEEHKVFAEPIQPIPPNER